MDTFSYSKNKWLSRYPNLTMYRPQRFFYSQTIGLVTPTFIIAGNICMIKVSQKVFHFILNTKSLSTSKHQAISPCYASHSLQTWCVYVSPYIWNVCVCITLNLKRIRVYHLSLETYVLTSLWPRNVLCVCITLRLKRMCLNHIMLQPWYVFVSCYTLKKCACVTLHLKRMCLYHLIIQTWYVFVLPYAWIALHLKPMCFYHLTESPYCIILYVVYVVWVCVTLYTVCRINWQKQRAWSKMEIRSTRKATTSKHWYVPVMPF